MRAGVLVDAHCHLDELDDPVSQAAVAREAGLVIVAVTSSPRAFRGARALLSDSSNVRLALGLHPLFAGTASEGDIREFAGLFATTRYVGEVGIDGSAQGRRTSARQRSVFEQLLGLPGAAGRLWSVHSRGAETEAISALEQARVPAILHWYSGHPELVDRALVAGLYFSVNLPMLRRVTGQRLVAAVPRERILSETDAPYGTRVRARQPAEGVKHVTQALARLWGLTFEEARATLYANMAAAFAATTPSGADYLTRHAPGVTRPDPDG